MTRQRTIFHVNQRGFWRMSIFALKVGGSNPVAFARMLAVCADVWLATTAGVSR
jgi:hypothetical protein